jgi:hypothetical protein
VCPHPWDPGPTRPVEPRPLHWWYQPQAREDLYLNSPFSYGDSRHLGELSKIWVWGLAQESERLGGKAQPSI